jgi:hypothetical protein
MIASSSMIITRPDTLSSMSARARPMRCMTSSTSVRMMVAISSGLKSSMVARSSASRVLGVRRDRCAWAARARPVSPSSTGAPELCQIVWNTVNSADAGAQPRLEHRGFLEDRLERGDGVGVPARLAPCEGAGVAAQVGQLGPDQRGQVGCGIRAHVMGSPSARLEPNNRPKI